MRRTPEKHSKRGVYLLPNLFTTLGLFAAFYAVVAAQQGLFKSAAIAIFIALLADMFDGRMARLAGCETEFGAEYDSLADMVSFGVAPALVIYSWSLHSLGKIGWLIAFIYTACTALRLARFNTQIGVVSKRYFQGLPSPAAASVIASTVWASTNYGLVGEDVNILMGAVTLGIAGLMVSTVRFYSFKEMDFKGRLPFNAGLINVFIVMAIAINPPVVLWVMAIVYATSGPTITLIRMKKSRRPYLKKSRKQKDKHV